jgi:hypothetical protein
VRSDIDDQSATGTVDVPEQLINEWWPVDPRFAESYQRKVAIGRETAAQLDCTIVMIARNARPHIVNTLFLLARVREAFKDSRVYVFENDSDDGTDDLLDHHASVPGFHVEHETLGGADMRGFGEERTNRLAYCRNKCLK